MVSLDEIDRKILDSLVRNSKRSRKSLSSTLGISEPSLSKRISTMEDAGIISNYSIDIDFGKLGLGTNAVTLIKLHDQHKDKIDEIATELRTLPIVVEIYTLLGETDLFIRWMAPSPEAIAKEMNKVLQKESMEKVTTLMLGEQLKSEKSPLLEK